MRTLAREPSAWAAYRDEVAAARGGNAALDGAAAALERAVARAGEAEARHIAERLALVLQAALLVRHAPAAVADLFCATRLGGEGGAGFGTLPSRASPDPILPRILAVEG